MRRLPQLGLTSQPRGNGGQRLSHNSLKYHQHAASFQHHPSSDHKNKVMEHKKAQQQSKQMEEQKIALPVQQEQLFPFEDRAGVYRKLVQEYAQKVSTTYDSYTYPNWDMHAARAEKDRLAGCMHGTDFTIAMMKRKQSLYEGDRSHPQLVALDSHVFSYPGWADDYQCIMSSYFWQHTHISGELLFDLELAAMKEEEKNFLQGQMNAEAPCRHEGESSGSDEEEDESDDEIDEEKQMLEKITYCSDWWWPYDIDDAKINSATYTSQQISKNKPQAPAADERSDKGDDDANDTKAT